ncbi:recombinase family protein [Nonomuraea ferruginea]
MTASSTRNQSTPRVVVPSGPPRLTPGAAAELLALLLEAHRDKLSQPSECRVRKPWTPSPSPSTAGSPLRTTKTPQSSRAWQITRSRALIEARGGVIVAEFFDIDKSRSIPWQRRPHAAALLTALRNPDRGFDAVVIGEPHRAFYGNQYGLTFPVFEHFGVPLWVPEVGGPIDPTNEAHDLVMSVFGGMSKGERNRIKVRVRTAMSAQAQMEGRFLGGRPPYGYRLADAGPHPNPAKAADGKRAHRLELDPAAAPVVEEIFAAFLDGYGLFAIAERLTHSGIPCPSAHDPGRNRHRSGIAWSKSAIRAILTNPRYTGHQVWNRQRKDEVLIDVDDVGLGHTTKLRWNSKHEWVWSETVVHPPIVSKGDFDAVQATLTGRGDRHTDKTRKRTPKPYQLRGLLYCGVCDRRMQGQWVNDAPYYRCRFPEEYALANRVMHPRNVYLREDRVVPRLDRWLGLAVRATQSRPDPRRSDGRAGSGPAGGSCIRWGTPSRSPNAIGSSPSIGRPLRRAPIRRSSRDGCRKNSIARQRLSNVSSARTSRRSRSGWAVTRSRRSRIGLETWCESCRTPTRSGKPRSMRASGCG